MEVIANSGGYVPESIKLHDFSNCVLSFSHFIFRNEHKFHLYSYWLLTISYKLLSFKPWTAENLPGIRLRSFEVPYFHRFFVQVLFDLPAFFLRLSYFSHALLIKYVMSHEHCTFSWIWTDFYDYWRNLSHYYQILYGAACHVVRVSTTTLLLFIFCISDGIRACRHYCMLISCFFTSSRSFSADLKCIAFGVSITLCLWFVFLCADVNLRQKLFSITRLIVGAV